MDTPGKPTANTTDAAVRKSTSFDLVSSGDKCFLCGHTIEESSPIGFYQGRNSMARCHRGCLNQMEMVGGTPKDFHEYREKRAQSPVHDKPVHQDVESFKAVVDAPEWNGPRVIQFDDFAHMQNFIAARGAIPAEVRVLVGSYVLQAGG